MGINNLQLTPEFVAALYPESLLAVRESNSVKKTDQIKSLDLPETTAYPFLGKHLRKICFLTHYPNHEFIPDDQLVFLNKMLAACKYSLEDIALINIAKTPLEFAGLKKNMRSEIVFLWGVSPESVELPSGLPDFIPSSVDGVSIIPVLSPDLMNGDSAESRELKKRIWNCLQKLFNL